MRVYVAAGTACLLLTTACAPKEFNSTAGSVCEAPTAVFTSAYKVGLQKTDSLSSLPAGRELEVILKNSCEKPGKIASQIKRDELARGVKGERSYHWKLPNKIDKKTFQKWVSEDPCVVGLADDVVLSSTAFTNDPKLSNQTFLNAIKAEEAWPIFYDARLGVRETVVIAVVDSGTELTHEDLKGLLWTNADEIPGNGIDDDRNGYRDDIHGYNFAEFNGDPSNAEGKDHGTHVAGLAVGKGNNRVGISGTMPAGAQLMTLNVFGESDVTRGSATANAVRYAVDNGADVINLSLGGGFSETLKAAIVYAVQKGAIVVAAAGNSGLLLGTESQLAPGVYGSSINGLMTVGSVSSSSGTWSSFSNYSARYVEIAAPGQGGMLSTLPDNTYGYKSGTSMATPVTAGAAALAIQMIRAKGFDATPARVELALKASATRKSTLTSKVVDGRVLNLKSLADYINGNYRAGSPAPNPPPPSEGANKTGAGAPCAS